MCVCVCVYVRARVHDSLILGEDIQPGIFFWTRTLFHFHFFVFVCVCLCSLRGSDGIW